MEQETPVTPQIDAGTAQSPSNLPVHIEGADSRLAYSRRGLWKAISYATLLVCIDCAAILLAFVVAFWVRFTVVPELGFKPGKLVPLEPYLATPWLLLCWPATFYFEGLYRRGIAKWDEQIRMPRCIFFGGLGAAGITFVFHTAPDYSRAVLIGTCLVAFLTIPAMRAYWKARFLNPYLSIRSMLVIQKEYLEQMPNLVALLATSGYKILHIISPTDFEEGELRSGVCLQTPKLQPEEIIVCQQGLDGGELARILRYVESAGVRTKILSFPSIFQLQANVRNLDGLLLLDLNSGLGRPFSRFVKRTLDIILSSILLILLSPIFLIIAILIRCDSPGPIFYRHRRLDYRNRLFPCLKFRTMYRDADAQLQRWMESKDPLAHDFSISFKLKDDPRITRVGKFLRATSLDELPQLLNVLQDHMSLVGPRPIVPDEIAKYGSEYQYLQMAKGGMTGLWQVSGRNDVNYQQRIALDVYYVRNWSLWLDISILLETIVVVLKKSGAY